MQIGEKRNKQLIKTHFIKDNIFTNEGSASVRSSSNLGNAFEGVSASLHTKVAGLCQVNFRRTVKGLNIAPDAGVAGSKTRMWHSSNEGPEHFANASNESMVMPLDLIDIPSRVSIRGQCDRIQSESSAYQLFNTRCT